MKKLLLAAFAAIVTMGVNAQGWTAQAPADGDFYLYNVGTGTFLSCGEDWGTHAVVGNGALKFTLANNGSGAYTLYTTSTFSYGNPNAAQLQSSGYVDQNVNATTWTFGAVDGMDNTYTLLNAAGKYLCAPSNGTIKITLSEGVPADDYGYWKLVNYDNLFPETASVENPSDITCLIGDASFESSNNTMKGFWTMNASNQNLCGGSSPNKVAESWQSAFTLSQTITVPNGYYRLRAQGFIREYTVTGTDYPVVYLNDATKPFIKMKTETASLGTVSSYFANGDNGEYYWTGWTDVVTVTGKSITIGARGTRTNSWCAFDNFQLQYLGPIDLSSYVQGLADAVSAAEATEGTIPTAAYNEIAAIVTANNKAYDNEDDYTAAIVAINNAVNTYASSEIVAAYSKYQTVRTAVLAVDGSIDVSAADALANDGTDANLDDALASIRGIFKTYLATTDKTNVDLTVALLVNPSFEDGFTGWTNNGMVTQTNTSFAKDGNYYCEHWQPNGTFGVSQVLTGMPSGVYRLTVDAKTRGVSSAKVFAGGIEVSTKIADEVNTYTVEFACDANADITFGFEGTGTGAGSSWLSLDNFRLALVSAGLPDVEAVTGKMNADVAAAQASAIETYEAGKTVAGYNATLVAIAAAQASKDAYASLASVLTELDAVLEAAETATASTEDYDAIKTAYNNGTIADNDIHSQIVAAYDAVIPVIKSQTANEADFTYAIQNHSFEYGDLTGWTVVSSSDTGVRELSNNTYATNNADGNYIFNTWWQGVPLTQTVAGLPNGEYTLTVTVASDAGATIYLLGNDEHNAGTQTTEKTAGIDATFTFLVKQGNATIGVVGSADDGSYLEAGHWWYKADNFRLVKNRDLTPEEAAIVPADLAIDATKTVFVDKTVTLTPTSTTNEASISGFVTWTSDNTSVATVNANGVVTAKAYGTANITVTSTLNSSATATCAVTVTAPTYDQLVNLDFAEGPVVSNHIRTYAKDKTGTDVAQMQDVTGWTMAVDNGDARAAGVMAYGSSYGMGNNTSSFYAPAKNPNGEATGNAFGMVGVWGGTVQYVQKMKLPAGAYTITVPVYRVSKNDAVTASAKNLIGVILDDATEYLATTKTYSRNTWTTETIKFNIESDTYGKLSIGVIAPNAGSDNCQRLWIDGITINYEPFASASEIAALTTAIEDAENGHTLGFEDGQYAPYSNVAALKTIAAAKALNTTEPIAQSEVTGATTAIESATWNANDGDVDAIYNGMFATVAEGQNYPDGWKRTNGWGQMRSDISGDYATAYYNQPGSLQYGNQGVYTMPLAGSQAYKLTFSYRSHENNSNNGVTVSVKNGDDGLNNVVFSKNGSTSNWKTVEAYFTTGAAGDYVLTLANSGNTWMTNVSLVKVTSAAIEISENASFTPAEKYANITLNRTIKADTWNTFCVPFDITNEELVAKFGADVAVAEFSENSADENDVQVAFNSMTTPAITANKPVLLKGNAGTSFEFSGKLIKTGDAKVTGTNVDFVGAYAASTDVAAGNYFISGNKLWKSAGNTTLKGTRAYIDAKNVANVRMFIDDMETSISEIDNDGMRNGEVIYNMAGQRVSKAQKGLYIVNGKKVIVK